MRDAAPHMINLFTLRCGDLVEFKEGHVDMRMVLSMSNCFPGNKVISWLQLSGTGAGQLSNVGMWECSYTTRDSNMRFLIIHCTVGT